ncbi:C-C motif chemokine 19-like [Lepisosteus oculatus]|uniref:C-C motif chemokine 19-like n=1 Tax=Lepisosteus oculatus TaxID=7918 RepID=UPI00371F030B
MTRSISSVCVLVFLIYWCSKAASGDMNIAVDCCLDVSNAKIPMKIVKTYQKQSNRNGCKIEAMVFITKRNVKLCAPHNEAWVKELTEKVDKRNKGCKGFHFKKPWCHNLS